jgi:alkylated DNA repair dioxygenase AlkB
MTIARQLSLFDEQVAPGLPEGFAYRPEFLSPDEEARLASWMAALPFQPFQFHGYEGKRRVISFGWQYDFTRSHLTKAENMPAELAAVRAGAAAVAGVEPRDRQQCRLIEYLPGAPIGWHRDRPVFETVLGISLLAPCAFRLRRRVAEGFERAAVELAPRSIYRLSGVVRSQWEHSIPPVKQRRYSITFRNFRGEGPPAS